MGFHAHALLFSWPSVRAWQKLRPIAEATLGEHVFSGRLRRDDGQSLRRAPDPTALSRQDLGREVRLSLLARRIDFNSSLAVSASASGEKS